LTHNRADNDSDNSSGGFDPAQVLLRYKVMILFCGVIAAGVGYLHYISQPRVYESAATVWVVPERSTNLPVKSFEGGLTTEDDLTTQMLLIRSPNVMDLAVLPPPELAHDDLSQAPAWMLDGIVSALEPANVVAPRKYRSTGRAKADSASRQAHRDWTEPPPMVAVSPDPAGVLLAGLSVSQARGENGVLVKDVLSLRFRGSDPQQCAQALSCVIQGYQRYLGQTREALSEETVSLIRDASETLEQELQYKQNVFNLFRQNSNLIWDGEQGRNIRQDRLAEIEAARSTVAIRQTELAAQIKILSDAIASSQDPQTLELLALQFARQQQRDAMLPATPLENVASQLRELAIEEQLLLEKVGPQHRKVKDLRKRIELTRQLAEKQQPSTSLPDSGRIRVEQCLEALRQELTVLNEQQQTLDQLFQTEEKHAREISEEQIKNAQLLTSIARTQQFFDVVMKRLDEINLIKGSKGTYAQVITAPSFGVQVAPRLMTTLASATLLGLAIGFVIAAIREMSNREFRSLDEVTRTLQSPVMGQLAQFDAVKGTPADSLVAATLFAFHQPKSPVSEAYRGIRTSIYFSTRGLAAAHKIIQVTSPMAGDGKTTLTANLAVTIAQSGKRVLLIEADLRRPGAARMFGLKTDAGLVAALNGDLDLDDCIHETDVENLWILPVGTRPFNPSELLSSAPFVQLLEVVREKYDFVLIDSPPLLPVTDASVIAAAVDGVVLLLRVRRNMRSGALLSMDKLRAVGANVIGVVVRGQFEEAGQGRAARYDYGYQYGYGYGYGNSEDDDHESSTLTVTPLLSAGGSPPSSERQRHR
jgi:succinoglycan biosynthesis transport protein ExoP